ncbi:MAG: hypothetical protein II433_10385, partial [Acidaminococcaceae bacterium]|nr:hypothetical protein [Acidaminococcaceae bacterium]
PPKKAKGLNKRGSVARDGPHTLTAQNSSGKHKKKHKTKAWFKKVKPRRYISQYRPVSSTPTADQK